VNTGAAGANHRYLRKLMLGVAPNAASRQRMEELMATSFKRDFIDDLEDEAEARGEARGLARGEARGEARGKALDILRLMDARGLKPTQAQRDQVSDCSDLAQLGLWFDQAITAASADEALRP
jgi:predicted transposase YdaD